MVTEPLVMLRHDSKIVFFLNGLAFDLNLPYVKKHCYFRTKVPRLRQKVGDQKEVVYWHHLGGHVDTDTIQSVI